MPTPKEPSQSGLRAGDFVTVDGIPDTQFEIHEVTECWGCGSQQGIHERYLTYVPTFGWEWFCEYEVREVS